MAIKGQLARIERQLANQGNKMISFLIPYCSDKQKSQEMKQQLLLKHNLIDSKATVVFALDFSSRSLVHS
jgi:hypothetical protein